MCRAAQLNVLRHVLAFNYFLVVELELFLLAVGTGAKHIDLLLLGEVSESAAERNGVQKVMGRVSG